MGYMFRNLGPLGFPVPPAAGVIPYPVVNVPGDGCLAKIQQHKEVGSGQARRLGVVPRHTQVRHRR